MLTPLDLYNRNFVGLSEVLIARKWMHLLLN